MTYDLIDTPPELARAEELLAGVPRISLDCEAAGFHRYSDKLCLVQLSIPDHNLILDPLGCDLSGLLKPVLEDPEVQVVMHGADYDIRLLNRDLGIRLRGLFDTQAAASLLGEPSVGLASLLETHLGLTLPKAHQRADWAQRPLPPGMLEYAANDTMHLPALADVLKRALEEKGRETWAREEFSLLENIRWEEDNSDPVTRVKGARDLTPRELLALREALSWRDEIARQKDRAPFRVAGDQVLLAAVVTRPGSPAALGELKGMSPHLARRHGEDLIDRLRKTDDIPDAALEAYPRWRGDGAGRPTPEEEAKANRIRDLRTEKAGELGLDRGVLLSNAQISEIVRRTPRTSKELEAIPGIRRWQAEVLGADVLRVVGGS
jgi:ribonuclease D